MTLPHKTISPIALSIACTAASSAPVGHLRLKDNLDRLDGYCLDVMGSGRHVRFDLPMTAHNCKPGLYHDEAVSLVDGTLRFPAYGVCATAAGLNGKALPGAAIMPRPCGESSPFMEAKQLQQFKMHADGKVELAESGLCLTVSDLSAATFEPTHRWRSLFLQSCETSEASRSQWVFVPVQGK